MQISNNNSNQTQSLAKRLLKTETPSEESPRVSRKDRNKDEAPQGEEEFAGQLAVASNQRSRSDSDPSLKAGKKEGEINGKAKSKDDEKSGTEKSVGAAGKVALGDASVTMRALGAKAQLAAQMKAAQNAADGSTAGNGAKSQLSFEDPRKQMELRGDFRANGVMTDVLGAGPNQPWNSSWVFGSDTAEKQAQALTPPTAPGALSKLQAGSDEHDFRADAGELKKQVAGLEQMLAGLGAGASMEAMNVSQSGATPAAQARISEVDDSGDEMDEAGALAAEALANAGPAPVGNDERPARANAQLSGEDFLRALAGGNGIPLQGEAGAVKANGSQANLRSINGGAGGNASVAKGFEGMGEGATLAGPKSATRKTGDELGRSELTPLPRFETISLEGSRHAGAAGGAGANFGAGMTAPVLTGNVVPGSMMRERLASESVVNFSNQIASYGPKGGGEMKIRLNPENLGELLIAITTKGKDVSLKVQSTRGEAKKILEESAQSLKEALGTHNLTLGKLEFTVVPEGQASANSNANSTANQSASNGGDLRSDQQGSQYSGGNDRETNDRGNVRSFAAAQNAFARNPRQSVSASSGRLDVTA